jgi:magnesium-transporting ATPase (P-type)
MCKPTTIEPKGSLAEAEDHQWHAMSIDQSTSTLGLSKDIVTKGLTTAEAKQRLEQYGPNQLTEKERRTLLQKIWDQVANVLVLILVVVAVVSLVKGIISTDAESRLTNFIEVGLITFVIT